MLIIKNPATGEVLREIAVDGTAQISEKVAQVRQAQPAWAARPLSDRVLALRAFAAALLANVESLATLLSREVGKPISQARNEIKGAAARTQFLIENVARVVGPEQVYDEAGVIETIAYEPLGTVANISAWNYPYLVGVNVIVPALLTGNGVLYKASEFATLTGIEITRLLHEAGVPRDVFQAVLGDGKAGATLLEQNINGVFFTGSVATGRKVAEAAGRRLIKAQLELGGKDPVYVCDDVDIAAAAESTADGAFYNNGQSCCSVERIYVHEKIYDAFLNAFVKTVAGFRVGDPLQNETYIGPLTRSGQIPVLERQVKDAVTRGARLLTGGARLSDRAGPYFAPTVVAEATHDMEIMRDESFGPVIGIARVSGDAEAVRLMNDTEYGLTAGVYAKDQKRAEAILRQIDAGSAYWNCCDRVSPRLPWSGRRNSGLGSTLSWLGILAFVQPKAWHLRKV